MKDPEFLENLNENDKKIIGEEIQDLSKWYSDNPNATKKDIDKKKKSVDDIVQEIIDKSESQSKLKNKSNELLKRLRNPDDSLNTLSSKDKKNQLKKNVLML